MWNANTGLRRPRPENLVTENARIQSKRRAHVPICRNCEGKALRTRSILRTSENAPVRIGLLGGGTGIQTAGTVFPQPGEVPRSFHVTADQRLGS
jgi:hypothetical protein